MYATSDGGWVAISASTQAMTERLFRAIGRDDLNQNAAFRTNTECVKRRGEVDAIVGGFIKQRTLAEAIEFFEKAEVTAAPVYDIGQFLEDPHVQERGIVVEAPDDDMGEVPMHAVVRASAARPAACAPSAGGRPAQPGDLLPHRLLRRAHRRARTERRHLTMATPAPAARR